MTLLQKPFENIVGNEENAGNQHFLFYDVFYIYQDLIHCLQMPFPPLPAMFSQGFFPMVPESRNCVLTFSELTNCDDLLQKKKLDQ